MIFLSSRLPSLPPEDIPPRLPDSLPPSEIPHTMSFPQELYLGCYPGGSGARSAHGGLFSSSSPCFSNNSSSSSTLLLDSGSAGGSCCSSTELDLEHLVEETYTSSLFQTEPLYQFYDKELGSLVGGTSPGKRRSSKQVKKNRHFI